MLVWSLQWWISVISLGLLAISSAFLLIANIIFLFGALGNQTSQEVASKMFKDIFGEKGIAFIVFLILFLISLPLTIIMSLKLG